MIHIDICVPAHNEEVVIKETLASLREAMERARQEFALSYSIFVGCNGCTDKTEQIAQSLADQVFVWPAWGKWKTLQSLSEQCQGDWVFFVDAGTCWNPQIFDKNLYEALSDPKVMAYTLKYLPSQASFIEKVYWTQEAFFKFLEMKLGGLIAVSGFSMFYRRELLQKSLGFLNQYFPNTNWLNDDIILPLSMRLLFPKHTIKLLNFSGRFASPTEDIGLKKIDNEKARRKRMMRGNLQWIRNFMPLLLNLSSQPLHKLKLIFLLLRRLIKIFWAYVFVVVLMLLGLEFAGDYFLNFLMAEIVFIFLCLSHKKIGPAMIASFRAPWDLFFWKEHSEWN